MKERRGMLRWALLITVCLAEKSENHDVPSALSKFRHAPRGGLAHLDLETAPRRDADPPRAPAAEEAACLASIPGEDVETHALRHIVPPPDGPIALVCCATTKGPLSIAVHPRWAPRGAQRFMDMVRHGHFNDGVPMMRCLSDFLCQFGLSANASRNARAAWPALADDPPWLPHGPKYRSDASGGQRFKTGYLAYAGAGANTRGQQLIVANHDDCCLAGGSPWEVPIGELVGAASFRTLARIYTGCVDDDDDYSCEPPPC